MGLSSDYYISLGSSTCFGCWYPSSAARTAVITASGTGQLQLVKYAATNIQFKILNCLYWMLLALTDKLYKIMADG